MSTFIARISRGRTIRQFVLAMLSSRGVSEPNKWLVALWAALSAAVAIVLLYVGALSVLQTFNILVAAPFVLVMCGPCWALYADLRRDPLRAQEPRPMHGRGRDPREDDIAVRKQKGS